jgi:hypothetical protein
LKRGKDQNEMIRNQDQHLEKLMRNMMKLQKINSEFPDQEAYDSSLDKITSLDQNFIRS